MKLALAFSLFAVSLSALAELPERTLLTWYRAIDAESPSDKKALSLKQIEAIYEEIERHRVTRLHALPEYDPEGVIGFCFGRAMAVHLMARKLGLAPSGIKKFVMVGRLRLKSPKPELEERFNSATALLAMDGRWYVIDTYAAGVARLNGPL